MGLTSVVHEPSPKKTLEVPVHSIFKSWREGYESVEVNKH